MRFKLLRTLNALLIFVLMGILSAAYYQQYFKHELPCPLCILQRLGMIGVSIGALLNLRFGIRIEHYALSLFSAFYGGAVAIRQICLHICPGFPIFGIPVFGINLYTWSFLAFFSAALAIIFMLFFHRNEEIKQVKMNWFEWLACTSVYALTLLNFITTFDECGIGPCRDVPWPQPK
ncbi:MAG: disulfide bond formation protein B [Chlamydiae bacterium]|nr:disulfide bond formation protein B [Chlamydiota bacterium]